MSGPGIELAIYAVGGALLASGVRWVLQKTNLLDASRSKYDSVAAVIIGILAGIFFQTILMLNITFPEIRKEKS